MPISFVGSNVGQAYGGTGTPPSTTLSLSALQSPSGTVAALSGDYCVLTLSVAMNVVGTNAISVPSGWTRKGSEIILDNASQKLRFAVFTKFMGVTPDTSVTLTHTPSDGDAAIAATLEVFRGVNSTTPDDVSPVTSTVSFNGIVDPNAITPSTSGTWIVICGGATGDSSNTSLFTSSDLSSGTNHFRSTRVNNSPSAVSGMGFKSNWTSGAFDAAAWEGGGGSTGNAASMTLALKEIANFVRGKYPRHNFWL